MKNLKVVCIAAFLGLFLASCSHEEPGESIPETGTLSFAAVLNDLAEGKSANKQAAPEYPECSDDLPSYVRIVLSQGGTNVVGSLEAPFRVDLVESEFFTEEVPELELVPGTYSLDYFAVYADDGTLLWIAPPDGAFADTFLPGVPLDFNIGPGAKKYLDVGVICFDDRLVNEYGYLFFDIEQVELLEFCIFGNYCDEGGRHYPAHFSVNIWEYEDGSPGDLLHSDVTNTVTLNNDGDYTGTTVCVTLPDSSGEDLFWAEITLLNSDAYGAITERVIRSGVFSDEDIRSLFVGDDANDYFHFREGCDGDDQPILFDDDGGEPNPGECDPNDPTDDCDGDTVPNADDLCPGTPLGIVVDDNGCEDIQVQGRDIVVFNDINLFKQTLMADPDNVRLVQNLVNFETEGSRNDGDAVLFDRGRNARCYGDGECSDADWATLLNTIEGEGFSLTYSYSTSGSLTNIPADVKIIWLVMPTQAYTVAEINTLKRFAAEGGRIIFVGEWEGYYNHIPVQNQFLLNMGAVLTNTGGAVDCFAEAGTQLPNASNRVHPIMEGIEQLSISCSSVIEPGPQDYALYYDISNTNVLSGVAKIDTSPISELKTQSQVVQKKRSTTLNTSSASGY